MSTEPGRKRALTGESAPATKARPVPVIRVTSCPDCKARKGKSCRTADGKPTTTPHVARRRIAVRLDTGKPKPPPPRPVRVPTPPPASGPARATTGLVVRKFEACLEAEGTRRGYKRHHRAGEKACDPCQEANRLYEREQREKRLGRPIREPQPCGTPAAYRRHLANRETACTPCLDAWAAYERERAPRKTSRRKGQGPRSAAAKAARKAAREQQQAS